MDVWRWVGTDNVDYESETLSPSQPMIMGNFPWNTRSLQFGVKHASGPGESGGTQKRPDIIPQNPKPKSNQTKQKRKGKKKERKETKTKWGDRPLGLTSAEKPSNWWRALSWVGQHGGHCQSWQESSQWMAAGRPDCIQTRRKSELRSVCAAAASSSEVIWRSP